ncbi:MAG: polyprenyl synthetase family protein [Bacteroidetes bacterium]|nr:MAG: polyprenyl synthetase family protein [Bacteroidota bacterium]
MIETDRHLEILRDLRDSVDSGLASIRLGDSPEALYRPVRYSLENKGKRIRPLLTLLAGRIFGAELSGALDAAIAVEIFHTFTLVHDDIMDKSDTRRGRKTVHTKWDESTAILVGDLLLGITPSLLAFSRPERLPEILVQQDNAVRALCEGQVLDMGFETRTDVSVDEYLDMIDRKTGFLLKTSLIWGGLYGHATDDELDILSRLGFHLGRAFQIQDDLLDLTAMSESWGKPVGGDIRSGKMTYLLTSVLEARDNPHFEWWRSTVAAGKLPLAEVDMALERLRSCGIIQRAEEAVIFHFEKVGSLMRCLPECEATDTLEMLLSNLRKRKY